MDFQLYICDAVDALSTPPAVESEFGLIVLVGVVYCDKAGSVSWASARLPAYVRKEIRECFTPDIPFELFSRMVQHGLLIAVSRPGIIVLEPATTWEESFEAWRAICLGRLP